MEDTPRDNFILGGNFNIILNLEGKSRAIQSLSKTSIDFKEWVEEKI